MYGTGLYSMFEEKQMVESESSIYTLIFCVCHSAQRVLENVTKVTFLSSSGKASPSASSSLFILSYSLAPSSSFSTSPHIPSPIPPGKDSSELLTESISREDSRQTVCFSAGCFSLYCSWDAIWRQLPWASHAGFLSQHLITHTDTQTHSLTSMPVMTAKHTNSDSCINMSTNRGWQFTHKLGCVWKTHTHTYHNPDICCVWHACRRVHTQTHKNTLLTGHGFTVTHAEGEHTNTQTKTKCGLASSPSPILKLDAAGVSGSTKTLIWLQS